MVLYNVQMLKYLPALECDVITSDQSKIISLEDAIAEFAKLLDEKFELNKYDSIVRNELLEEVKSGQDFNRDIFLCMDTTYRISITHIKLEI